jgi:cobalt-zinc-cadmium resistance protein CzcA
MPELEEGNLWIRATFPLNASLEEVADRSRTARAIMRSYPEVELVVNQIGRPDDGTDSNGFYNSEFFVPLNRRTDWPAVKPETGWRNVLWEKRARSKDELSQEMNRDLALALPGVNWNFSQNIRDNVMESLSGVKGDNSVKIIGPDLEELEHLADKTKTVLSGIQGIENVGVFHIMGQPNLEFPVDRTKCARWGFNVADVQNVIKSAVGGAGVYADDRRGEDVRHYAALATAVARQRGDHSGNPGGHHQQHGDARYGSRSVANATHRHEHGRGNDRHWRDHALAHRQHARCQSQ